MTELSQPKTASTGVDWRVRPAIHLLTRYRIHGPSGHLQVFLCYNAQKYEVLHIYELVQVNREQNFRFLYQALNYSKEK